jgi:hypothetical protein
LVTPRNSPPGNVPDPLGVDVHLLLVGVMSNAQKLEPISDENTLRRAYFPSGVRG